MQHSYCVQKQEDWFDIYLDVKQFAPFKIYCWCDNFKLLYDTETSTFSNNLGVETRVPCFGDVCGIEYIDLDVKVGDSSYFHDIIEGELT